MGMTLLEHWRESLQARAWFEGGRTRLRSKIYRFLLGFYAEAALKIEYPPGFPAAPEPMLLSEPRPRPLKSPAQIRMLLERISEAVAAGTRA